MAKEKELSVLEQEKLKKEKAREEWLKEEEQQKKRAEQEKQKKIKEREKKQKIKEKRQKKRELKEQKRIRGIIDLPFKLLLNISLIICLLFFIIQFVGNSLEFPRSLYYTFLLFVTVYLGGGLVMVAYFFILSDKRKKELEAIKKENEEKQRLEKERLEQEQKEAIENRKIEMEATESDLERRRREELQKFRQLKESSAQKTDEGNRDDTFIEGLPGNHELANGFLNGEDQFDFGPNPFEQNLPDNLTEENIPDGPLPAGDDEKNINESGKNVKGYEKNDDIKEELERMIDMEKQRMQDDENDESERPLE